MTAVAPATTVRAGAPAVTAQPTATPSVTRSATRSAARPLAGITIALDPGHQLGNANPRFRTYLAQHRFNGRIVKGCNTTGTSTNTGYPEATFTWRVALLLRARLQQLGARVAMTRTTNSWTAWGPCVWDRGRFGARVGARLMVQIHADGAPPSGYGFHIITAGLTRGWTDRTWRPALVLAKAMRAGMIAGCVAPSTYIRGALSIRTDQTAMNFARVPTVTVESGNMRNPRDAARMVSRAGQALYAAALLRGIRTYLRR